MRRLRNITITLEDDLAQWARIEAAKQDTSVSQLLAGILAERMSHQSDYERAMKRALARKPFLKLHGARLTREELHERRNLR
ncbi:MAG: CopG family transcriptional regulator [Acidobacteria bacterium]|nr:CopG family transcriptional regulator [Acidobacteriota bacterium]MBV9146644.1 CopG family transcriptional regulator [Acidobacteriota bacterium]MBV9435617.1 CopG family transcriptional regulator [Acidobacteriota bacterium]